MVFLHNALCLAILGGGLWGWTVWFSHLRTTGKFGPSAEPHALCRWGLFDLFLLAAVWVFFSLLAGQAAPHIAKSSASTAAVESTPTKNAPASPVDPLALLSNEQKTRYFLYSGLASLGAVLVAAGLIAFRTRSSFAELGLGCQRWAYDVWLGRTAFAMTAPLILAVQASLVLLWPSKHPLIEALKQSWSEPLYAAIAFTAVIGAPVFEEFAFRVLLYGWLRNWVWQRPSGHELLFGAVPKSRMQAVFEQHTVWPLRPSRLLRFAAMLGSALAFGLMHLGHGPDWVPLTLLGLVLAWLYERTGRIWPCITVHLLLNAFTMLGLRVSVLYAPPGT